MNNNINKLEIYREAMRLGEVIWTCVLKWDYVNSHFKSIGKASNSQLSKSTPVSDQ